MRAIPSLLAIGFPLLMSANLFAQAWSLPVREIPRPGLPDVAMAGYDEFGPVIYYNPAIVLQMPRPLVKFFQAHEYGHHDLNHMRRELWEANAYTRAWVRQEYEREADCYAARVLRDSDPDALEMAARFFATYFGAQKPDWYHPTGFDRAAVIASCGHSAGDPPPFETIMVACTHAAHPNGDCQPCVHPAHPYGDVFPCGHLCMGPYGPMPCHPNGDIFPCSHPLHPYGDCVPCTHPLHPEGDPRQVPRRR